MRLDIQKIADSLLSLDPEPLARHALARLTGGEGSPYRQGLLQSAALAEQPQARRVLSTQRADGSWGRFHSMDTRLRQTPPTTEAAIQRLDALGFSLQDEPLARLRRYLERVLSRQVELPDPPEANERWAVGTELIAAASLARLDPANRLLEAPLERWAEIVSRAFAGGGYRADREAEAQRSIHGLNEPLRYLHIHNRYTAELLGARPAILAQPERRAYARWLCHKEGGIGYLEVPIAGFAAREALDDRSRRELPRWLESVLILARLGGMDAAEFDLAPWLERQQGAGGLWDFGRVRLPRFSSSWRRRVNRKIDHTLHALRVIYGWGIA